ncbi:bifunctional pyr operon transcriptional regulator/uracil phosphoribosyltransferase PyrR [Reichenbachiella versicolor]|uniref:bifunctional pyr operon transcriptional regulator/uracil phosphoribosyltransferase PyrR n=1 Tax=Reichenbachiella versicolor TaxID=1821036 RepID=UPI000D6E6E73|nr:bifunctional pyr operon transcriptional regulator/uracil phosphoribosyltransferase PyrR [Reichenbachiella versicolor]
MQKRLLLNHKHLSITISRLCHQLIENHKRFENTVLLGLQPKGIYVAERIKSRLKEVSGIDVPLGYLDITFYRDDFRRRDDILAPNETKVPFIIEKKNVILIDDVLYTGRTVKAAMDAMNAFGRPDKVEFLALIDRIYSRHIPVEANYVGKYVNTVLSQKVLVELTEQGKKEDKIWLIERPVIDE